MFLEALCRKGSEAAVLPVTIVLTFTPPLPLTCLCLVGNKGIYSVHNMFPYSLLTPSELKHQQVPCCPEALQDFSSHHFQASPAPQLLSIIHKGNQFQGLGGVIRV